MTQRLLQYGAQKNPAELSEILSYIFERNNELASQDERGTPVCIWGTHSLRETQLVRFAKKHKWKFAYIARQFEEMGDLHGMPVEHDPTPDKPKSGDEETIYYPPDWVPKKDDHRPGILLLDDLNRADDRILRGCMQLLQNFELKSWKLPSKWQIVATANPEGGDYSVTPWTMPCSHA